MAMDERWSFGALLRHVRLNAGLTLEELAERATLSPRTISDLERGVSRRPRRETLALLLGALELDPAQRAALEAAARPRVAAREAAPGPARAAGNLPIQLTSFVGRRQEIRSIERLLGRDDTRLVTVTGPGGSGKTRLAHQVAAGLSHAFTDGVCYVGLAAITDPAGIVPAIARALGLSGADGHAALPGVVNTISGKQLLLLLDNFEHLTDGAPLLLELLRGCPRLTLLVTSRAALRLSGEQVFPIAPFPVPDVARMPAIDVLADYPAIALLVDRATRVKPEFALTPENARDIVAICSRLDGLPLAIELAAARLNMLSPRALLARLDGTAAGSPLRLLTSGPRDLPSRQQTLRDTIAWSYNLLDPAERSLFRRLAVFTGGCTLAAAEAVCRDPAPQATLAAGDDQPRSALEIDVLDGLASLADKSLLYQVDSPDGEPRFLMLETIRAFALEQLVAQSEVAALRQRHAAYYLAMVEATGPLLFAAARERALVANEHDNIQAALRWLVQHG